MKKKRFGMGYISIKILDNFQFIRDILSNIENQCVTNSVT